MYKIYTDKTEEFNCKIQIEGAELSNSKARLVIEGKDFNLLFNGSINSDGKCSINISKLKMLNEGLTGTMKLEVIADDTYFTPWEDKYVVETSKKVVVEVEQKEDKKIINEGKPKVAVEVRNSPTITENKKSSLQNEKLCLIDIKNRFLKENITVHNLKDNTNKFKNIISESIKKFNISEGKQTWLTNNIVKFLGE